MAAAAALTAAGAMASGIAGIASAGANYRSQNKTNQLNYQMFKEQQKYDKEMYEQQLADTWEMWNATNEYNSASNQVSRLKEAGLNPAMMLGSMNAGSASTSSTPSLAATARPNMQAPQIDSGRLMDAAVQIFGGASSGIEKYQQLKQSNQAIEARDIDLKTQAYRNMIELQERIRNVRDKDLQYAIQSALKDDIIRLGRSSANNAELESEAKRAQISYQMTQNALASINLQYLPQEKQLSISQSIANLNNTVLDGKLTKNQIQKLAIDCKIAGLDYQKFKDLYGDILETYRQELKRLKNNTGPQTDSQLINNLLMGKGDYAPDKLVPVLQKNIGMMYDMLFGSNGKSDEKGKSWYDKLDIKFRFGAPRHNVPRDTIDLGNGIKTYTRSDIYQ